MTLSSRDLVVPPPGRRMSAVLCGSFRRDRLGLRKVFDELTEIADLLSPRSLEFVNPDDEFVRLAEEANATVGAIEQRHLDAITEADFVWLHVAQGHVGTSAALEVGHARALGVPVLASNAPADPTIAAMVELVPDPQGAIGAILPTVSPGAGLAALQRYYGRVALRRGWMTETALETFDRLTGELGELADEVRESERRVGGTPPQENLAMEMADVQLYLVHLANIMGVDLAKATTKKEQLNAERFADVTHEAAA